MYNELKLVMSRIRIFDYPAGSGYSLYGFIGNSNIEEGISRYLYNAISIINQGVLRIFSVCVKKYREGVNV